MKIIFLCKFLFYFVFFLLLQINFEADASLDSTKNSKYESVNSYIKSYYENIINTVGKNQKKGFNWMHRWLWNHRFEEENAERSYGVPALERWCDKRDGKENILSETGWVPVGPVNIPVSYDYRSCYALGRVNCISFHPQDTNIFWIGTPGGGIWKTENGGKNWIPLGDNLPTLAISDIAVDPKNPDIIYIATGDFDASGYTSSKAMGIYKTTNGGCTWDKAYVFEYDIIGNKLLRRIIINPKNIDELIAAGRGGIYKSKDAGETWKLVYDSLITDMEINPEEPQVVYADQCSYYGNYGSAGIMKSTDFGDTWQMLNTGIPPFEISRIDITVSQADPEYIYAVCVSMSGNWGGLHSFWLSNDAGITWKLQASPQTTSNILGSWDGSENDPNGQGTYDLVVMADPINKNKVYVGGVNIWVSENEGVDWDIASFWIYVFGVSTHADQHFAAYNPGNKYLYWCNDGGVYRTKEINPGSKHWITDWIDTYNEDIKPGAPDYKFPTAWENLTDGLAITEFYRIGLNKNKPDVVTSGSQDNSCYYYNNTGDWVNYIPNYDGMETMVDYNFPNTIYGVWQFGGLCKSTDGGRTLTYRLADTIISKHGERGQWITPVAMDPANSSIIYIGFRNLWRSTNGGFLWKKILDFDSSATDSSNKTSLQIVKTSYNNPNYIAVYKANGWYYNQEIQQYKRLPGELWLTKDRGVNWELSSNGLPHDSMNITSIEYDSKNPEIMWAVVYSNFTNINTYKTTDGGASWGDISKPLSSAIKINTIVHQPDSPTNILYIGTNFGVYYTDDSFTEWLPFNKNLPRAIVNELEIQPQSKEIYAATYGRGIWKANLLPITGIADELSKKMEIFISPNPSDGNFVLILHDAFDLIWKAINIKIVDVMGRLVYYNQESIEGESSKMPIESGLGSGVYFIQVIVDGKRYSGKVLVKK